MGLELTNVQRYATRVDETTGQKYSVLVKDNPYVRLNAGEGPPIFIQGGIAYAEGGDEYDLTDLPPWFMDQASVVGEVVAKQCGLDKLLKELEKPEPSTEPAPDPKPKILTKSPQNAKGQFVKTGKAKSKAVAKKE